MIASSAFSRPRQECRGGNFVVADGSQGALDVADARLVEVRPSTAGRTARAGVFLLANCYTSSGRNWPVMRAPRARPGGQLKLCSPCPKGARGVATRRVVRFQNDLHAESRSEARPARGSLQARQASMKTGHSPLKALKRRRHSSGKRSSSTSSTATTPITCSSSFTTGSAVRLKSVSSRATSGRSAFGDRLTGRR